jgi:hypothetical protein
MYFIFYNKEIFVDVQTGLISEWGEWYIYIFELFIM